MDKNLDKFKEDYEILVDPEFATTLCDLVQKFLHGLRMLAGVHTRLQSRKHHVMSQLSVQ
jgi:hypothetical protein